MAKILVVDDEEHIVRVVKDRLEANGYTVTSAFDGEEAMAKYQKEKFDLIILDVTMPKLDGFCVSKKIREQETSLSKNPVPIIMLTGRDAKEDEKQGYISGSDLYLRKPLDLSKLSAMVEVLLKGEIKVKDKEPMEEIWIERI